MRWLVAFVVVASLAARVDAKIVIMEPPLARACETAVSWPKLMECMAKHGLRATIAKSIDGAKLVVVSSVGGDEHVVEAFAVYVAKGQSWKLGGMLSSGLRDDVFEILKFERVTLGTKHTYRFDIASAQASFISLDRLTSTSAQLRQVQATFCNGASYNCVTLVPQCTQLVHGQAYTAFAGRIDLGDNQVTLSGAGTPESCSGPGKYPLGLVD